MSNMDQRKWLRGLPASDFYWQDFSTNFTLSPPSPSQFTILSRSGNLEGIQVFLHFVCCSDLNDRHLNMLTLPVLFKRPWMQLQSETYPYGGTITHPWNELHTISHTIKVKTTQKVYEYMKHSRCDIITAIIAASPPEPLFFSGSRFPACPTSHRCSDSVGSQQPHRDNPAHWGDKIIN